MCIEGYPERNCPTILVYKNEDIVRQVVTLAELGGTGTRLEGTFRSRVGPFQYNAVWEVALTTKQILRSS